MTSQEIFDLYGRCVIANYARFQVAIVRAQGSRMWDADGKCYLDLFPGWGCSLLGYCHPRVVEAIRQQAGKLIHIDNLFFTEEGARLGELIHRHGFGGQSFFCNSGAEANEAAIKLARRHAGRGRYKIITMERSFHGRTYGAMSATAQSKTHAGHEPLVPGFVYVPFQRPRRGQEGGHRRDGRDPGRAHPGRRRRTHSRRGLPAGPARAVRRTQHAAHPGRGPDRLRANGHLVRLYQHYPIEPDIMTLAKALGGGAPIGAMVAQPEVAASLKPGAHASTYGANPLVVAAAIAMFEAVEEENLLDAAKRKSAYILEKAGELQRQFGDRRGDPRTRP